MLSSWRLREKCGFLPKNVESWTLSLEWKLNDTFTSFKPKSTEICGFPTNPQIFIKIRGFYQNPQIFKPKSVDFVDFPVSKLKSIQISVDFAEICRFYRFLHTWGLGLASSKVFSFFKRKTKYIKLKRFNKTISKSLYCFQNKTIDFIFSCK